MKNHRLRNAKLFAEKSKKNFVHLKDAKKTFRMKLVRS